VLAKLSICAIKVLYFDRLGFLFVRVIIFSHVDESRTFPVTLEKRQGDAKRRARLVTTTCVLSPRMKFGKWITIRPCRRGLETCKGRPCERKLSIEFVERHDTPGDMKTIVIDNSTMTTARVIALRDCSINHSGLHLINDFFHRLNKDIHTPLCDIRLLRCNRESICK